MCSRRLSCRTSVSSRKSANSLRTFCGVFIMTDGDGSTFPVLTAFHRSVESCRSAPSRKAGGAPRSNDEGVQKRSEAPGLSVLSNEKDSQPTEKNYEDSTEAENGSNQKDVFSSNQYLKNPSVNDPTTHLNLSQKKKKKISWIPLDREQNEDSEMKKKKKKDMSLSTIISSVGSPVSNDYSGENVVSAKEMKEIMKTVKSSEGFPGHFSKMQHLLKIAGKSSEVR